MGIFDSKELINKIKGLEKRVTELNSKHDGKYTQLLDKINLLKAEVAEAVKKSPEYEKEAKESSRKASEYRNKAQQTLDEVRDIKSETTLIHQNIENLKTESTEYLNDLRINFDAYKAENEEGLDKLNNLNEQIDNVSSKIAHIEEVYSNHPKIENELSELDTIINRIKETESKSHQLVKNITNRKIELDTIFNEILGYEDKDENGNDIFINGSKHELLESLEGIEERVDSYVEKFEKLEELTNERSTNLLNVNSEKIAKQVKDWEEKYVKLSNEIQDLLPGAVTAGLSHAFSSKKKEEDTAYDKHKLQFGLGILSMILVSLIPFAISVHSLFNELSIDTIINRAPKIVIAILPLYIPVLWLTYSSNKKMNLSKRLIEEYAHKEVLSKTFQGLSREINDLEEDNISKELKIKLLQDFLQMYSENPGKLISDYNKTDHPVMELLENSNKLDKTIQKLQKFPGLSKVAEILETKSNKKIEQVADSVERILDNKFKLNGSEIDEDDNKEAEA